MFIWYVQEECEKQGQMNGGWKCRLVCELPSSTHLSGSSSQTQPVYEGKKDTLTIFLISFWCH